MVGSMAVLWGKESDGFFSLRKMLEVGKRSQEGRGSGKMEATRDWRMDLTPFS